MQYRLRLTKLAAIALAGSAFVACAPTTTLEQTWTMAGARNEPPLQRVVTVFTSDNITIRRAGEDQLARDLREKGVEATPSYSILASNEVAESDATRSKLRSLGFDGLVVMNVVERYQQLEYSPASYDWGWGWGWGYGYSGYGAAPYTETVVRIETRAYSLRTNQLVWSALTRTEGEEANKLIDDTSEVVAGALTRRGLAG